MAKINENVLPLPYAQVVKFCNLFFCFLIPFALAPVVGWWTPAFSFYCALGFFGVEQIGTELESPYDIQANDMPLLSMAQELCKDIDAMHRTTTSARISARRLSPADCMTAREIAADYMGWGVATKSPEIPKA